MLCLAAFIALGVYVTGAGEPAGLLAWERSLLDRSTLIAWWLTWLCYPHVLVPILIVLAIVAWRVPSWRVRIIVSIALLLIAWQLADYFQHLFDRPRRLDWVVKREKAGSYPSSHAAIATGFYAFWAVTIYCSELPRAVRIAGGAGLLVLTLAICWARLALGAHYLTDLAGGVLLGVALISTVLAAIPGKVFGAPAGRP